MIDREHLYQLLYVKDWDKLSEQLYVHRSEIDKDPVLQQVASLFESEFMGQLRDLAPQPLLDRLRHITLVISSNRGRFAETFWRPVMELKLQALFDLNDKAFPGVASEFADALPLARDLLARMQQHWPEQMADARRSTLNVKAVAPAAPKRAQHVQSLFRSPQERSFYEAMRLVFPSLLTYPNVAMSTALDFDSLKGKIAVDAREFFFRGAFDCVLFDPADDHRPLHFFELDSSFHNTPDAQRRDRLKDEICAAAGVKLLRLRAFKAAETTTTAFEQLIRELVNATTPPQ